jgi:prophage regulatory protein
MIRIIKKPVVREITSLSDSTVRRLELAGDFPRRIKLSKSAVGWDEREVLAWIEARKNEGATHA